MTSTLRTAPHNIDAEKALLGAIMLRPVMLNEIIDTISSEDFYAQKHATIYRAMLELSRTGDPIDIISVTNKLRNSDSLDASGGPVYLNEIAQSVPSSANSDYYARIVKTSSLRRKLIDAGNTVTEIGYTEKEDIETNLDQAEKAIFSVTSKNTTGKRFVSIKELLPDAWEKLENLSEDGELRGVPTGYESLDRVLSGLQPSDLIILAARPSTGKTSLALDMARKTAVDHNISVGFFSLEMSADQLTERMLSAQSQVDAWRLRTGRGLTDDDFGRISQGMEILSKAPIYIDDKPGNSILNMRSTARKLKAEHGLGLIVVDYLQLMTTHKNYDSMVNQVTEISRSLKSLARELEVPVLALSQLSRAVEQRGGRPRLSDLRDSGSIEQDADVVLFLHRERNEEGTGKSEITEILIEKHRNGATGYSQLYFDSARTTFLELDKQHNADGGGLEDEF